MTFAIAIGVLTRAQLERLLVEVASRHAPALLRIKGAVRVVDATQPLVVQAVHDRVYPLVALDAPDSDCAAGALVFIVTVPDAAEGAALEADIRAAFAAADARARRTELDRGPG